MSLLHYKHDDSEYLTICLDICLYIFEDLVINKKYQQGLVKLIEILHLFIVLDTEYESLVRSRSIILDILKCYPPSMLSVEESEKLSVLIDLLNDKIKNIDS